MTFTNSKKYAALALVPFLFLANGDAAHQKTQLLRRNKGTTSLSSLGQGSITLVESSDTMLRVTISQTLFGSPQKCEKTDAKSTAALMVATYLDPDTLKLTCGLFKRDANACFNKSVWVGCDPATNTATIDLYVKDETFTGAQKVNNPKLDKCNLGGADVVPKAIKISASFDCFGNNSGPGFVGGPGTCSDTTDECGSGTYCNFSEMRGYECKQYVSIGDSCGGYTIFGEDSRCNPNEAYCFFPKYCEIPDIPGECTAYGKVCKTDADCQDSTLACDTSAGRCIEKLMAC